MVVGRLQDANSALDGWRDCIIPRGVSMTYWRSSVNNRCDAYGDVSGD